MSYNQSISGIAIMINKQYKKILLSVLLVAQVGGTISAMAQAQEPGFFATLGGDLVSLAKGVAYGVGALAQGVASTYLLARNNPKTTLALAVGIPLLTWGIKDWHYRNYVNPRVPGQALVFSNWKIKKWPSASSLRKSNAEVLVSFGSEFAHVNAQQKIDGLKFELDELTERMKALEEKYLVCNAPFGITLYDIKQEFESALKKHAKLIGEESLNTEHFAEVNDEMEKTICSKILPHLLLSINYREAARLWWKLKVKQLRLKAILHDFVPVAAGRANDPNTHHMHSNNQAAVNVASSHTPL